MWFRVKSSETGARRFRVIFVRPPELREVPAEVQFKVAPNTVADVTDLCAARLRVRQRQEWEDHIVARLQLAGGRHPESIELGLGRSQRFTVERCQTRGERIHKRIEL